MHASNKRGAAVPTDILMEILSRLRVKALIRLKSVCKGWLQLISSEEFIKLHLKRSSSTMAIRLRNSDMCPGLPQRQPYDEKNILQLGSSCDGLVCFFDRLQAMIHIWNPAIRKSAAIPTINMPIPVILKKPMTNLSDGFITCFWFGLHDNEYKVVLGAESQMHIIRPYNINNYSQDWTRRQTEDYCFCDRSGTFFNGDIHWPVLDFEFESRPCRRRIYSLNFRKGKAREIWLPIEAKCGDFFNLGEVGGCLAALLKPSNCGPKPSWFPITLELWAMKEYGVEESWTKIRIFKSNSFTPAVSKSFMSKMVLDGDSATYKSPLYTVYTKKKLEIYVESLVPPLPPQE